MKRLSGMIGIFLLLTSASGSAKSVVLAEFTEGDRILSRVTLSGPPEVELKQEVEFVLQIEAEDAGSVSEIFSLFLVPQTSLSRGGGVYVFFDNFRGEEYDSKKKEWIPLDMEKIAQDRQMGNLALRSIPFGVGVLASLLIDKEEKEKDELLSLGEEERQNYFKQVAQIWPGRQDKFRIILPVKLMDRLTKQEKLMLRLQYKETTNERSGAQRSSGWEQDRKTSREVREVIIDDLIAALQGKNK